MPKLALCLVLAELAVAPVDPGFGVPAPVVLASTTLSQVVVAASIRGCRA